MELTGATITSVTSTTVSSDTGHLHLSLDGTLVSMTGGTLQVVDLRDVVPGHAHADRDVRCGRPPALRPAGQRRGHVRAWRRHERRDGSLLGGLLILATSCSSARPQRRPTPTSSRRDPAGGSTLASAPDRASTDVFRGAGSVAVRGAAAHERREPGADRRAAGRGAHDARSCRSPIRCPRAPTPSPGASCRSTMGTSPRARSPSGLGPRPAAPTAPTPTATSGPTPLAVGSKAALYAGLMLLVAIAVVAIGLFDDAPAARRRLGVVAGVVAPAWRDRVPAVPAARDRGAARHLPAIGLRAHDGVARDRHRGSRGVRGHRDARRALGALGRRRGRGGRSRAPCARRARGRHRHAVARRDDPVDPHAGRCLLGGRTAAARAARARAARRPSARRGAPLLEHGAGRNRRRRRERTEQGGRRAGRLERSDRRAGNDVRANARGQGDGRARRDRAGGRTTGCAAATARAPTIVRCAGSRPWSWSRSWVCCS